MTLEEEKAAHDKAALLRKQATGLLEEAHYLLTGRKSRSFINMTWYSYPDGDIKTVVICEDYPTRATA